MEQGKDKLEQLKKPKKKKNVKRDQFRYCYRDIRYGEDSPTQKLDIYLPSDEGKFPVVFFVHGGAWAADSKICADAASIFKVVSQGYAIVAVDYRLSGEAIWPAQINDVFLALDYTEQNADKYHLDMNNLFVWGNSAGGHLVQMAAAIDSWKAKHEKDWGQRIKGVISWYGVFDMTDPLIRDDWPEETLLGGKFADIPQTYYEASPLAYITERFPRILIQQGIDDPLVPWTQAKALHEYLAGVCGTGRSTLELFAGGHGSPNIKCDANMIRCIHFLDELSGISRESYDLDLPEIILED